MVKVSIKKNIKPKKITTKKTVKPKKKVMKEKENKDQTQTQNVIVNVNETITKKKRGRPAKRSTIEKKPAQQQPITQSYNQPIFKQSTPQPSTLTSSILASQNIPRVIKEEAKEESALKKALIEQNLSTAEDPIEKSNDLERVRNYKPKVEVKKEEPIRSALLGQLISEQGDDTEEIQQLIKLSKPPITAFKPFNEDELTPLKTTKKEPLINPLTSFSPSTEPVFLTPENKQTEFFTTLEEQQSEPVIEEQQSEPVIEEQPFTEVEEAPELNEEFEEEEIPLTPQKETTILEPPKKVKSLVSLQAEEPEEQSLTEIKVVDEEPITVIPGLEEFIARIQEPKLTNNDLKLILQSSKTKINLPKQKNRTGYENTLIQAFKDGLIS